MKRPKHMPDYSWIVPLITAALGGVLVKVLEVLSARYTKKVDEAATIRKELREEIATFRAEMKGLQSEVNNWRTKYYELLAQNAELQASTSMLRAEVELLRGEVGTKETTHEQPTV
jgi:chromosome segregation ATPase